MFVICVAPIALLALADHGTHLMIGGHNSGLGFDYGAALSEASGILAVALLAPLVGLKRRVALWWILPPVGLYYACIIGARVAVLSTPPAREVAPQPPSGGQRAEDLIREHLSR
jgi:hypothetical protein